MQQNPLLAGFVLLLQQADVVDRAFDAGLRLQLERIYHVSEPPGF